MERKVIVICGPTASGKTSASIHLAKLLNTEIISADSRQFYKYLDIGTAKPSHNELSTVKHHFINFLVPDQDYNVSRYRTEALDICNNLWNRGQIPVITGGSGLYIKSLIDGFSYTPDPDAKMRERLMEEKNNYGPKYIYDRLAEVDPASASTMLPQNWKRVIRALEVYYQTGKKLSDIHSEAKPETDFISSWYGLLWEREILYSRINDRVDGMIRQGLVEEVRSIAERGYDRGLNSLNTVGYKEINEYLDGRISFERAVELIKRNTRRYAKRQLTWFRREGRIKWESIKRNEDLIIFAGKIAAEYESQEKAN